MDVPTSNRIDLWFVFYRAIRDAELCSLYRALLSHAEREREQRFHRSDDRHRYLVTRATVRTVLSGYSTLRPGEWRFDANPYGRPQIQNEPPELQHMAFNISHTDGLIVVAVTRACRLGVDVENMLTPRHGSVLPNWLFASEEAAEVMATPDGDRYARFLEYWTLKESYAKARGVGLSLPLAKCSFSFPSATELGVSIHPDLDDAAVKWVFWQAKLAGVYLLALCRESVGTWAGEIVAREIVPLQATRMARIQVLRGWTGSDLGRRQQT